MRISINAAIANRGPSGTARVVEHIKSAAEMAGHDVELVKPPHKRTSKAANAVRATWWDFRGFDSHSRGADLCISPANAGFVRGRPHVLWVQDTMVLDHPDWFDRAYALHARATFGPSIRHATTIVTASADAASRIRRRWPGTGDKVRVIPWPSPAPVEHARTDGPSALTVLMLGATEPHKDHALGIAAVRRLRSDSGRDIRLRIVGPAGRADHQVRERLLDADPSNSWTSRETLDSYDDVQHALDGAWLLLQCSRDEGFCLPLVEAAARALPVVHTGTGSMLEVHPQGFAGGSQEDAIVQKIATHLDRTTYEAASTASLEVARRHDVAGFRADIRDLLEQARRP